MSKKCHVQSEDHKRKPGRPPTYVFSKPDSELSENERRLKSSVIKRRQRQNRSYHRKKRAKELAGNAIDELNRSLQAPSPVSQHTFWPPVAPSSAPQFRTPSFVAPPAPAAVTAPETTVKPARWSHPPSHALSISNSSFSSAHGTASDAGWASSSLPARQVAFPFPQGTLRSDAHESAKTCFSSSNASQHPVTTYSLTTEPSRSTNALPVSSGTTYAEATVQHTASEAPNAFTSSRVSTVPAFTSSKVPQAPSDQHPAAIDEKDEESLLDEMLDMSSDRAGPDAVPVVRQPAPKRPAQQDMLMRLSTLPKVVADGLKDLVLFPGSFDSESALAIMGVRPESKPGFAAQVLQPLVHMNFAIAMPGGRYLLNEAAKGLSIHSSAAAAQAARKRFVSHFISKMERLGTDSVNRLGKDRLNSMKLYALEQGNMRAALQMCHDVGGKRMVINFLAKGATIMRYAIPGHERTEMFGEALREIENMPEGERPGLQEKARIMLALAEAHFDVLDFKSAESHLNIAIALMAKAGEPGTVCVSFSVLALLLLGELNIREGKFTDAQKVLVQALSSLESANLQESTFAVCCWLSLVSVYMSTGETERALRTGCAAVNTLRRLGFQDMPIYADALGTLGTVHFTCRRYDQAQDLFFGGLKIIEGWISGDEWENAPYQHCTFLDIFLNESIAQTYVSQNRHEEASQLMVKARRKRAERNLAPREEVESSPAPGARGNVFSKLYPRHVY